MRTTTLSSPRFGELLLAQGLITPTQLTVALGVQAEGAQGCARLGDILVAKGWLTPAQALQTRARQLLLCALLAIVSLGFVPAAQSADDVDEQWLDKHWSVLGGVDIETVDRPAKRAFSQSPLVEQLKAKVEGYVGTPVYTLFKGEYRGGVDSSDEGMAYKASWSHKGLAMEVKYQF